MRMTFECAIETNHFQRIGIRIRIRPIAIRHVFDCHNGGTGGRGHSVPTDVTADGGCRRRASPGLPGSQCLGYICPYADAAGASTSSRYKTTRADVYQGSSGPPDIQISGTTLEVVEHFRYLGSHLSQKAIIEADIQHRICCANTSFRKLRNRVFDNHNLRKATKVVVYKAICITTLLYGSEAWVTHRCHPKTLEKYHQRCHRKSRCIRWEDRCSNASVLIEACLRIW